MEATIAPWANHQAVSMGVKLPEPATVKSEGYGDAGVKL